MAKVGEHVLLPRRRSCESFVPWFILSTHTSQNQWFVATIFKDLNIPTRNIQAPSDCTPIGDEGVLSSSIWVVYTQYIIAY